MQELGLEVCKAAKQAVWRIQEAELPREIGDWIASHPGQTAFMFAAGAVFFAPSLITVPVLESLGFTVGGVTAGEFDIHIRPRPFLPTLPILCPPSILSLHFSSRHLWEKRMREGKKQNESEKLIKPPGSAAAFVQAMIGNVATGSVFALLQSAAAGGAGEAALNGMTMATAGIAIGAAAAS